MKNSFIILFIFLVLVEPIKANNLNIKSSSVSFDKKTKISIFKDNVIATDSANNIFKSDYAEYNKNIKLLKSIGKTSIITSEGFFVIGKNIIFDNKNNIIKSEEPATIIDLENNNISLEKFIYSTKDKFFRSTGNIKLEDSKNNSYNFTQIYIDEKKREIIGTDIKAFLNDETFKIKDKNKPRVFANTVKINDNGSEFDKSVFTLCDYREKDKCPPWSLRAKQMTHDKKKKTIFYKNAVIKVYDVPIFYLPKLSHPDPSVTRRSGFLPPSFSDSKNLGPGFSIPYFWALNTDKDVTLNTKLFSSENPLFLGEYRQAFEKSNLILDFGYTEGYKKTTNTKIAGNKSHLFAKFIKDFKGKNNSSNNIELSVQEVSNDKYLKLYKIDSNLANYEIDTIENSFNFTSENDNYFLGLEISAYETLKSGYNDKYEYILPDVILDRNLFTSSKYGNADFTTNLKVHNYDTNKFTKFFVNDIDWKYPQFSFPSGIKSRFSAKLKNVNYEAKNTQKYKDEPTSEFFGALGYLTELDLFKEDKRKSKHFLTPKMLLRYAPGNMRKEIDSSSRLDSYNVFSLDRLNTYNNFENGLSTTLGFDYGIKSKNKEFLLNMGQIIKEKNNSDMPSSTSLDKRFSDVVGSSSLSVNKVTKFNYNFALDQNYKELNYNEAGINLDLNPIKFDFSYLEEKEHIGNQEYLKANIELTKNEDGILSFKTKRNLITNSSEYYNLSYEYLNDCLRAGLVYRREFYNDSELEPENSLMFKITLTPFGNINSPSFSQ